MTLWWLSGRLDGMSPQFPPQAPVSPSASAVESTSEIDLLRAIRSEVGAMRDAKLRTGATSQRILGIDDVLDLLYSKIMRAADTAKRAS